MGDVRGILRGVRQRIARRGGAFRRRLVPFAAGKGQKDRRCVVFRLGLLSGVKCLIQGLDRAGQSRAGRRRGAFRLFREVGQRQ